MNQNTKDFIILLSVLPTKSTPPKDIRKENKGGLAKRGGPPNTPKPLGVFHKYVIMCSKHMTPAFSILVVSMWLLAVIIGSVAGKHWYVAWCP